MHVIYDVKLSVKRKHIISIRMHCEKELITKRSESEAGLCVILIPNTVPEFESYRQTKCRVHFEFECKDVELK